MFPRRHIYKICLSYVFALAIFMLFSVITMKKKFIHCDIDQKVNLLDRDCKQTFYASLELRPYNHINCSGIVRGDLEAVEEALIDRLIIKNKQAPITEEEYINMTMDCKMYKKRRKFITFSQSKEEEDFPIAYSMVIHENIEMFERLLRAIYVPQNIYCVHVDEKSPDLYKRAVKGITSCFDNVFVASKLEKMVYASWSRVQADLNCMEDLLKSDVQWKYLLNTCGTDFPIKTNAEMVRILYLLKEKNNMESEATPAHKTKRWQFHYEISKHISKTNDQKSPPPNNIKMFSGGAYVIITRSFVKFLFENPFVAKLIEWEKDTYSPDEHLWATLNRMPDVPGSVPSHKKYDMSDMNTIARLVKWQYSANDMKKGGLYPSPCSGAVRRGICIYGTGDLPWILQQHHLFANKFDPKVDNNVIQCLEHYLRHKALYDTEI